MQPNQQNVRLEPKKSQKNCKWLKLVHLSHTLENMEIKNSGFLTLLMLSQVFFGTILPNYLLVSSTILDKFATE